MVLSLLTLILRHYLLKWGVAVIFILFYLCLLVPQGTSSNMLSFSVLKWRIRMLSSAIFFSSSHITLIPGTVSVISVVFRNDLFLLKPKCLTINIWRLDVKFLCFMVSVTLSSFYRYVLYVCNETIRCGSAHYWPFGHIRSTTSDVACYGTRNVSFMILTPAQSSSKILIDVGAVSTARSSSPYWH